MYLNKTVIIFVGCLVFGCLIPLYAGAQGGEGKDHKETAGLDYGPVFETLDKDHDGKITKDEWLTSGLSQFTYDNLFAKTLDTNQDGVVVKAEFTATSPQFEVDTSHDGEVSLEEYIAANNGREAIMKSGNGSAPPPTNHGAQGVSSPTENK